MQESPGKSQNRNRAEEKIQMKTGIRNYSNKQKRRNSPIFEKPST